MLRTVHGLKSSNVYMRGEQADESNIFSQLVYLTTVHNLRSHQAPFPGLSVLVRMDTIIAQL